MSRDKQIEIEKMACDMCTVKLSCNGPYAPIPSCSAYKCAVNAYDYGYRKASEGKWKPYKDYFTHRQVGWICSNCSSVTQDLSNGDTDYCPHCGAVMETESEGADDEGI